MSQGNDPFAAFGTGAADATFVMPTPGVRPTPGPGAMAGLSAGREAASDIPYQPSGLNPLLAAANPLLTLMAQMRHLTQVPDVAVLRDSLAQGIKNFETAARTAGLANEKVIAARYTLCTALDETAASTPWGGSGTWARHSLLVLFHNETWGGEKVFQLLAKLAQAPKENLDLLEFIYSCMSLGFQGRYRVVQNGPTEWQTLKERLAQMIRAQRAAYDPNLALNWAPATVKKSRFLSAMPLWIFCAVMGLLLLAVYMGLSFALTRSSDPLFSSIVGIKAKGPQLPEPKAAAKPRLAKFLEPEIQQGLVEVRDFDDRSIVTIRGDGLFEPASATLDPAREPLMLRIGDAIASVPGQVVITGHTDSSPLINSARFPSNWHLSQERAKSVAAILARKVTQTNRLQAEGRADSEPVAPNDTAQGKARNRRVELTVFINKSA
jgi:type VI secretion system protein ImpK